MTTQPSDLRACLVALEAHLEVVRAKITVLETAREALYALAARTPSLVDPTPRRVKRRPRVTRPRRAHQRRAPRATAATARRSAAKTRRSRPDVRRTPTPRATIADSPETPAAPAARLGVGRGQIDWQGIAKRGLSATVASSAGQVLACAKPEVAVPQKAAVARVRVALRALLVKGLVRPVGRASYQLIDARPAAPSAADDLEVVWDGAVRRAG